MKLRTLVYTSQAIADITNEDIENIHRTALYFNYLNGITGLLLFDGVSFFQVIEGVDSAIEELLPRLKADQRHFNFNIKLDRFIENKQFPDWLMNFIKFDRLWQTAKSDVLSIIPSTTSSDIRDLIIEYQNNVSVTEC